MYNRRLVDHELVRKWQNKYTEHVWDSKVLEVVQLHSALYTARKHIMVLKKVPLR